MRECSPPTTSNMSHFTCHVSPVAYFFLIFIVDSLVELVFGGSVINGEDLPRKEEEKKALYIVIISFSVHTAGSLLPENML